MPANSSSSSPIQVDNDDSSLFNVQTNADGPTGSLPLDERVPAQRPQR